MRSPKLPNDTILNLYVPSGRRTLHIADKSAIVGLPNGHGDDEMIEAYYEGDIFGQGMSFEEKLQIAAGRMTERAPTRAFGYYDITDLIHVGYVSRSEVLMGWFATEVTNPVSLKEWAKEDVHIGGSQAARQRAAGIRFGRMTPQAQSELMIRGKNGEDVVELALFQA